MQYKQVARILAEITSDVKAPTKIVLRASQLLLEHDTLPMLGPYRKRSASQSLWRVASDSNRSSKERWAALQKLLTARVEGTQNQDDGEEQLHNGCNPATNCNKRRVGEPRWQSAGIERKVSLYGKRTKSKAGDFARLEWKLTSDKTRLG
jgi:hypothetical protein